MLVFLLENPSDDCVELAIGFLKECGQKLSQVSPRTDAWYDLYFEGDENIFDFCLDVFKYDDQYEEIRKTILDESNADEDASSSSSHSDDDDKKEEQGAGSAQSKYK